MVYGKYVAKEPIDFNGVRAFQPGDDVPSDSVETHGWEDLVEEKPDTPPADDADSAIPPDPGSPSGTGQSAPPAAAGASGTAEPGKAAKKPSGPRGASSGG